jgi:dTMP kinase
VITTPHKFQGTFISYEGLDFSGKSTQFMLANEFLKDHDYIKNRGNHVINLREPGGTLISERVRNVLLDKTLPEMNQKTELLLFSSARCQLVQEVIIPALQSGSIVTTDRFYDTTIAYQGFGRQLGEKLTSTINTIVAGNAEPDLTFFVDISIEEMVKRRGQQGRALDRIETSGIEFYKRVQEGYTHLLKENPHRFIRINGERSIDECQKEIRNHIDDLLKKKYY